MTDLSALICTNCSRPYGEHPQSARFAYCPSAFNNGDDDMTFCPPPVPNPSVRPGALPDPGRPRKSAA